VSESPTPRDQIRTAEVIGSLCLATDLGMGFPIEHGLQATQVTMRICEALQLDSDTCVQTYYAALLTHVGCTVDAELRTRIFNGSMTESGVHRMYGSPLQATLGALSALPAEDVSLPIRLTQIAAGLPKAARFRKPHFTALCEVAEMLSARLGLPESIQGFFPHLTERWDGLSNLRRAKGEEIPLAIRIAQLGRDATYQRLIGGTEHAIETIRARSGHAFDPRVAESFVDNAPDIFGQMDDPGSIWDRVMAAEPKPWLTLEGEAIDRALSAMGAFSDLASPYLSGHSAGVGDLAHDAALLSGFDEEYATSIRRAGYLMDLGKVSVHPRIWASREALTADEWEQVRLHPYQTERILARAPLLAELASAAGTHHERLDGSGYHRGSRAASLTPECRLLAAADAFKSKTEPRAYRPAFTMEDATRVVTERAAKGKLDAAMVAAVIEAAGLDPPKIERPAGLTEREAEVIGHLARGLQTKQVARVLGISIKTADHHIQSAYRKIGVSTRAAATLFAAEHGLVQGPNTDS
jgi:HD-GYP domain-containing protein (c-di-GMP phosphodiesterase class II)